jgi:transcriptional regulator GlxA family with amidase domain
VISPDLALAEAQGPADIVIVTDLDLTSRLSELSRWEAEAAWLAAQVQGVATVCSVCTGSVLIAAAGLLDGWEATTHWAAA